MIKIHPSLAAKLPGLGDEEVVDVRLHGRGALLRELDLRTRGAWIEGEPSLAQKDTSREGTLRNSMGAILMEPRAPTN